MKNKALPAFWYWLIAIALFAAYIICQILNWQPAAGWLLMLSLLSVAFLFRLSTGLRGLSFSILILAMVSMAMYFPQYFVQIGNFKLKNLIIPLLQIIMFGMGTELSLIELRAVLKTPKGILVGVICHYTIMPLVGFGLANIFHFPKEIAAGIILVGCCPSGLASNVMAFLAKANLALSISVTTISTLLAPLFTPLLMHFLAGEFVAVRFADMVWDTSKVVLIPVLAGLGFHYLVKGKVKWLDKIMPALSMLGIALIIVVITAAGRDSLLKVGLLLIVAVFIHNTIGYTLGYWSGRMLGFTEKDCRTISLEVGMQNSGLASGLALLMGGLSTIGLAPAIFGPLMNITGSTLANYWHGRIPKEDLTSDSIITKIKS
jgi:BASS family bile acid:Na+ symporter